MKTLLLAKNRTSKLLAVAMAVLVVSSCVLATTLYLVFKNADQDRAQRAVVTELRVLAHKLATYSAAAVNGESYAFEELNKANRSFSEKYKSITDGQSESLLLPDMLASETKVLGDKWKSIESSIKMIAINEREILLAHAMAERFEQSVEVIAREQKIALDSLSRQPNSFSQAMLLQDQTLLAHTLSTGLNRLVAGDINASKFVTDFKSGIDSFAQNNNALIEGSAALGIKAVKDTQVKASIKLMGAELDVLTGAADDIVKASERIIESSKAATQVQNNTPVLLTAVNVLLDGIGELPSQRIFGLELALFSAGGIGVAFLGIGLTLYRQTVARLQEEKNENDRNQKAIQRLLGEISELADGNLAAEATVSEEFTGAIADSINFTVEQLRGIVSSINETTEKITGAAKSTQQKTMSLADSSNIQAREISQASVVIDEMAGTMRRMSEDAAKSSTVAKSSVEIAKSGARVVKNTIEGMDSIREQIQDTAKRIKRLGESSQEIGDIVSLITDIADQTNILALNASIQASMAGDAGRGFAVVADEVQRLAEKSSSATRQIEALVRTIQTDTSEAVISMEQTTSEVVAGASLTNDAGVALEEIERVSQNISELVTEISVAAIAHAEDAGDISRSMTDIKDMTSSTADETLHAARSMGHLSGMTIDLKESVAGFKMPDVRKTGAPKEIEIPMVTNGDLG